MPWSNEQISYRKSIFSTHCPGAYRPVNPHSLYARRYYSFRLWQREFLTRIVNSKSQSKEKNPTRIVEASTNNRKKISKIFCFQSQISRSIIFSWNGIDVRNLRKEAKPGKRYFVVFSIHFQCQEETHHRNENKHYILLHSTTWFCGETGSRRMTRWRKKWCKVSRYRSLRILRRNDWIEIKMEKVGGTAKGRGELHGTRCSLGQVINHMEASLDPYQTRRFLQ